MSQADLAGYHPLNNEMGFYTQVRIILEGTHFKGIDGYAPIPLTQKEEEHVTLIAMFLQQYYVKLAKKSIIRPGGIETDDTLDYPDEDFLSKQIYKFLCNLIGHNAANMRGEDWFYVASIFLSLDIEPSVKALIYRIFNKKNADTIWKKSDHYVSTTMLLGGLHGWGKEDFAGVYTDLNKVKDIVRTGMHAFVGSLNEFDDDGFAPEDLNGRFLRQLKKYRTLRIMKPGTQKHFGDILSNLNFNESFRELLESFHNYTPTVQEVQSFKLTPKEQKIVDILVSAAKVKKGYNVNTELVNYLENTGGLYQVIKDLFLKYISQIAGKFNFDEEGEDYNEDHAIKNMIRGEIMQPYMNSDVLYNLIYDNPDIDINDLEGLLSTGVRIRGQEAKEYVGQNTSGKINTTLYLFMFYDHKPDTVRKVAEVFVKYAILANFNNTDYMFERSLKPSTQKHFGGIIGNL